jgi:hypothetical protein
MFGVEQMRKILITNSYGAGWSSWCSGKVARFIATYQPIIDKLEEDKNYFKNIGYNLMDNNNNPVEPILQQLQKDIEDKFGLEEDMPYLGGAQNLSIIEIPDDCHVIISDHDGKEKYNIVYDCI